MWERSSINILDRWHEKNCQEMVCMVHHALQRIEMVGVLFWITTAALRAPADLKEEDEHLLYLALYWQSHCYISALDIWFLQSILNVNCSSKNICSVIFSIHSANEWMWISDLGAPQFHFEAMAVMAWSENQNYILCTLFWTKFCLFFSLQTKNLSVKINQK